MAPPSSYEIFNDSLLQLLLAHKSETCIIENGEAITLANHVKKEIEK